RSGCHALCGPGAGAPHPRPGRQRAYCACAGTLTIGTGAAAATASIVNDRIGRISALPGCDTKVLPPCVEPAHPVQARKGRSIGATLERDGFSSNRHLALVYWWRVTFPKTGIHFSGSCASTTLADLLMPPLAANPFSAVWTPLWRWSS